MTMSSAEKKPLSDVEKQLSTDDRDVKDLWQEALKGYQGIVGFSLERKFDDVQSMLDFGTEQMNKFHKFRHDKGKVDRLRTLLASNLDYVEKGANQIIEAASPAFPPAAAIGTALTYILQACRSVSADYDVVIVFFEDMNSFLQRISILEARLPQKRAYQNCLMEVFTSLLNMCGFAQKYIELGRFKKWITNLFQGEDSELGGARALMNKRLGHLQQATEFAILGNSEETLKMTTQLDENQRSHTQMLERFENTIDSINENTENIKNDVAKLLKLFGGQTEESQANSDMIGSASSVKGVQDAKESGDKSLSARAIRYFIPGLGRNIEEESEALRETLLPDFCNWVFSEPSWNDWLVMKDGERPVLAITGQPGIGKSHLAVALYDKLEERAREDETGHTCVVHFYFREEDDVFCSFLSCMVSIVIQIAETSNAACEKLKAQLARDDININNRLWQHLAIFLLKPLFEQNSKFNLFVVLDGLDEIRDWNAFKEFLSMFVTEKRLRMSLVVTSRPERLEDFPKDIRLLEIEATKDKQRQDFKVLIWHRINSLGCLKKFSRYVKQRVAVAVEETSPNMLYAEHMLTKLDSLGREGAVLKALNQNKPDDLNDIYEGLLSDCRRRTPISHQQIAASILHWIAFSKRRLTLNEVQSLLRHLSQEADFSLEDIPEFTSKFLKVADTGYDAELRAKAQASKITMVQDLKQHGDDNDDIYDDGPLPVKFQERSMRRYFTDGPHAPSTLRWGSSEAHRRIFLSSTKLFQPSRTDVDKGLQKYCAVFLLHHWSNIQVAQHTLQEQVEVLEAFAEALSNKTGFSKMMGKVGMTYRYASTTVTDLRIQDWAKLVKIPEVKGSLSDFAVEWWCRVEQEPATFRLGLAKGYLQELYQSLSLQDAMKAWECLQSIMQLIGKGNLLMEQGRLNFPDQFKNVKTSDETEVVFDEAMASLGILGLFVEDVTPDAGGHRATAEVLLKTGYLEPAEKTCRTALELCSPSNPEWYRASSVLCDILLQAKKNEDAHQFAGGAVSQLWIKEIPGHLKRAVCTTYARAQTKLRNFDSALQYYTEAKKSDPDGITPASDLVAELSVFYQKADQAGYIKALRSWTLLERITWLASNYATEGEDRLALLCDIAVQTGEKQFIVEFYEQVVAFLDNLDAGTPLRLDLAVVYFEACKDAEKALNTLNEIFDSHDTVFVYPITSVTPVWVMRMALTLMTNVQVELFRQSRDAIYKAERLQSLSSLMERPLSLHIPHISPIDTISYRIGLSYMYWVMGPKATFEETLRELFKESFEGLSDSIKWNDGTYVWTLTQALALLSRALGNDDTLRRYARIVGSALLSRLTRSQEDDNSAGGKQEVSHVTEGDEHGSEDNSHEDEGDLLSDSWYTCGGFCSPARPFRRWGDGSAYLYITFETGMICEECQTECDAMKRGEGTGKARYFHGIGHDYVKLPVEGWRGVKNGMLRLDGEEPVLFNDFLKKLQTDVIENAWDRLWSGEI
ncbi:NACHT and TPR domain-containing protein [Colletotrichum asianum]|uniref:NACHT and TPR domain-containing protein n=1 Tax=Colletotrichum asianum TaxID=702518 RepID=A0A8H3ZK18_9PEZI|nr:NACHT and TPR domain-containing protein [Colletotrichum asianum]